MSRQNEKARRMEIRRSVGNRVHTEQPARSKASGYLVACACFHCCKSFKRLRDITSPATEDVKCPQCGQLAHEMGRSFKAPRSRDKSQWKKVQRLYEAGFRFFSYRSYPDAEPLPKNLAEVEDFIDRNPNHPFRVGQPVHDTKQAPATD